MNPYLLPFEDFFTYLQQQGFGLGVNDFLQVQALLNRLPEDCPPERLKRLLCPLVASNQEEQDAFYGAFDRYFANMALEEESMPNRPAPSQKTEAENRDSDLDLEGLEDWREEAYYEKYGDKMTFTFWGFLTSRLTWVGGFLVLMLVLLFVGLRQEPNMQPEYISQSSEWEQQQQTKQENKHYSLENFEATETASNWWIIWLIVLGGGVLVLYKAYRSEAEDFYLETQNKLKPPHYWNIQVPKSELKFYRSSIFKQVSQQLQKRQKVPSTKMDVPNTMKATVEAAGYPSFRYLEQSELPEYLVLMPHKQQKDQRLQLFAAWCEALKEQEVWIHAFYYDLNQPEKCLDTESNVLSLKELYGRHANCRLLAFMDLENIHLNEINHLVDLWSDWQNKVLLCVGTPSKTMVDWSAKNDCLLFPANLESLTQINSVFEGNGYTPAFQKIKALSTSNWRGLSTVETVRELKKSLNPISFQWLCATALYPEMNWDLTVYIGETLFDERELVKPENVMPLIDLPWFRKGQMSDNLRMALITQLEEHNKFLAREAILHLLQLNPLVGEEYSQDFFDYQLHIALEEAQLHPEDQYKLSTLKHLMEQKQFAESTYKQVTLRYVSEQEGGKGLQLGKSFKKKFLRKDIEIEGVLTSKKEEALKYVYSKVHLGGRLAAMFVDVIFTFFILFTAGCCVVVFLPSVWTMLVVVGVTSYAYLGMDSWSEGSGFGKYGVYRVLDVRTNKPCRFWQSTVRRSFPLIITAIISFFIGMDFPFVNSEGFIFVCGIPICSYLFALWMDVDSRKIMDYLAHTQVVYEEDYQHGNFVVEKKEKESMSQPQAQTKRTSLKEFGCGAYLNRNRRLKGISNQYRRIHLALIIKQMSNKSRGFGTSFDNTNRFKKHSPPRISGKYFTKPNKCSCAFETVSSS